MKLFVTGGAGFIGSNFILHWLKNHPDDQIVNFDALTYAGNLENLRSLEGDDRHIFVKGNITDAEAVREAMKGCDMVVHYAAETHVDRSVTGPGIFVSTNVIGTQVLLDQAMTLGVKRFHHISTDEVFGDLELEGDDKFNEETPYNPSSPYSASKAGSDMLVRAYHRTYGLPITISNCSNNYGPFHFPEKLIPLMILNAMADKPLPVYGDGLNIRDWIHVEDHARAVELVLEKGVVGETYCVGGESERTNIYIVKKILEILGKPESLIQYVTDRPGHDRRYAIDNTKIRSELGFEPQYSIEEGLEKTIKWFKENESWWKNVLSQEYATYYEQQYGKR
ncbi:MAG: rfbB [Patescibacteria group bacterium]|nr:rfbB [Patescibacteria group bacterium]